MTVSRVTDELKLCQNPATEELSALDRRCFLPPWEADSYGSLLSQPAVGAWSLRTPEGPVGFLCWQQVGDEAELYRIGIVPERRGEGLGLWLMRAWLVELGGRGVRRVLLEVRAGNAPAAGLYQRAGFSPAGVRRGYYANPAEDALIFEKNLGG